MENDILIVISADIFCIRDFNTIGEDCLLVVKIIGLGLNGGILMKLSMWNLFYSLPYENCIPMILDGSPTITCARWIVTSYLNSDTVYVGKESEFFDTTDEDALIVHRHDMIIVRKVDSEEVFNEICCILDCFNEWENQLQSCLKKTEGLTKMLNISKDILKNPSFIYAPDGKSIAVASNFPPSIHWHWKEILENGGLTEERLSYLKKSINLTDVFQDTFPTIRDSRMDDYQYMHCSISTNGYMAGHFVMFSMLSPFQEGIEYLVLVLIYYLSKYIALHYEKYSPTSKMAQMVKSLIFHQKYEEEEFQILLQTLHWNHNDSFQIYVIKEMVSNEPVLLNKIYIKLSEKLTGSIVLTVKNQVIILENQTLKMHPVQVKDLVLSVIKKDFICGVSNIFDDIKKCALYYAQAEEELIYCSKNKIPFSFAVKHSIDHFKNIFLNDAIAETYVHRSLLQLKEYDQRNDTSYYETLRAYFYCGFHLAPTSKMLGIHRNSLSYRLGRIRELIDFQEFDQLIESRDINQLNLLFFSFFKIDATFK